MFEKLTITNWRQLSKVEIDFLPNLTILTGANAAGKTTILNLLSQNIGWEPKFVSSFEVDESGVRNYGNSLDDYLNEGRNEIVARFYNRQHGHYESPAYEFGKLSLKCGTSVDLFVPKTIYEATYETLEKPEIQVQGVYIHSHRPNYPYRKLEAIPTSVATREMMYQEYLDFNNQLVFDEFWYTVRPSATLLIKSHLAALAIYGEGNSAVIPNQTAKQLFDGYIEILKQVLPPKLGFEKINVVMPEVLLCTKTGNFPLDGISGGISSIIDITWQLYLLYEDNKPFVALIDEPENHLHPELQKSFLGNLIKAFPNVQFIVATHNPLIISSQKDSNVYMLDYVDNKVCSVLLDYVNRAGTSNAILREVLGVDSSMPHWAEKILGSIIEKYQNLEITNDTLSQLRIELGQIGLDDYIPNTIAKIVGGKN
jgi:predicted ATPase